MKQIFAKVYKIQYKYKKMHKNNKNNVFDNLYFWKEKYSDSCKSGKI